MNSYLKHYKIILKTIAPVFIGSGKQIGKREYIFDEEMIYVLDENKLINAILKRNLIDDFTRSMFNLKFWLNKNGMRNYEQLAAYTLSGIENVDERSLKNIQECVKDAYNKPYIPGSSLKGALRTVILWNEIYENSDKLNNVRSELNSKVNDRTLRPKELKKELGIVSDELEKQFFVKKINDIDRKIMQGLIIGDSKPLSLDDIVLCKKIDVNLNGRLGKSKSLLLRECIRPETEIEFDMTIDPVVLQYTADNLDDMLKNYAADYYNIITKTFPYGDKDENAIYIGGGSGFFSKTVIYSLFEKKKAVEFTRKYFMKTINPKLNHKHENDTVISPHMQKCTFCNGKMYEMGKCTIKIVEI